MDRTLDHAITEHTPDAGETPWSIAGDRPVSRLMLMRAIVVFQIKLALDGFRDLVMSPLSITAGIIGVLFSGRDPEWAHRRLMAFGRQTDVWINLFNAYPKDGPVSASERTVDDLIDQAEAVMRRDYAEGGLTARSKARMEEVLESLRRDYGKHCRRSGDAPQSTSDFSR